MTPQATTQIQRETLKLLLQAAWADDEVQLIEARCILDSARAIGLTDEELAEVAAALDGRAPLPAPNMGLLRGQREAVLSIVCALLAADQRLVAEEDRFLRQVQELLGDPAGGA